jgi:predicted transglutaminase-like cysteine proteinase
VLTYTKDVQEIVASVNESVNARIAEKTDIEVYDKRDHWTVPENGMGDCEDIALLKYQELRDAGLPAGALSIACCWTENRVYHAVLLVKTDRGDFVLDNRFHHVTPWKNLPYKWHKRSKGGGEWEEIVS